MSVERETRLALANGAKLALSLCGTVLVALAVRFSLPRELGPETFGRLHFAEQLSLLLIGLTAFGVDGYIGREVATQPQRASELFGGMLAIRSLSAFVLSLVMLVVLSTTNKDELDWTLAYLYAGWQVLFVLNGSLTALLNARGKVDELAVINVAAKLLWGGGIAVGLWLDAPLVCVPLVFIGSELIRVVALWRVTRRYLDVRLGFDLRRGITVMAVSMPFFLNAMAAKVYNHVDAYMISLYLGNVEVGLYGAASNVSGLLTMFLPVVTAVVLPMSARIADQQGEDAMFAVMRRAIRLTLAASVFIYVILALNADAAVRVLVGDEYAAAVKVLPVISAVFPLTYVCNISGTHLITSGRVWSVTRISLVGLVVNPLLNMALIPWLGARLGQGGGALGASFASLATEVVVTCLFVVALGKKLVDREMLVFLAKLALPVVAACLVHVGVDTHWMVKASLEVVAFLLMAGWLGLLPLVAMAGQLHRRLMRKLGRDVAGAVPGDAS